MSNKKLDFDLFKKKGLKLTRQRKLLSKILFSGENRHFTAEEIKKIVLKEGSRMSLATIYNNLHNLVEAGLLKKRQVDNNKSYFDNNVTDHYHLFDKEKNTLIDIPNSEIKFSKLPKIPKNKKVTNIHLVINIEKFR
tara:strand:- start:365 stop:775 length:411 start_codon:yes stop_codon:yes gene_type:complete